MKQHITTEQLNDLSNKAEDRLLKWATKLGYWYPKPDGTVELPQLTIGQMIEFLDEKSGIAVLDRWSDKSRWRVAIWKPKKDYYSDELCDALWEAVKEVLNKEIT